MLEALFAAEPISGYAGWTGHGHVNRCPNGHIYVTANCGGAVHTARCNECGATIGGANHRLAAGNTQLNILPVR